MSDHLVRRTRSFIKRTAKKETVIGADGIAEEREYLQFANGEKFHFPTRVATPLSHRFSPGRPGRADGRRQHPRRHPRPDPPALPPRRLRQPQGSPHTADTKNLDDIRSGRGNVSGFVRISLFKRLSSSGHSFILSLQRQRARNELFIHAIDHNLPIPLGAFTDKQITVSDEDIEGDSDLHGSVATRYESLTRSLPAKTKWVNTTVFKPIPAQGPRQGQRDHHQLLDRFGNWDSTRDSKMNALVDLLSNDHAGEKVLIFTEYSDTAELHRGSTHRRRRKQRGPGHRRHRQSRRPGPPLLAELSNKLPSQTEDDVDAVEDPIDVLIATDVLSEGQNLQDSHIIVNYDLPWAIIRIIQRAGRVDRIGQKSDTVHLYLITHEKIEQQIRLRQRIKDRLGAAAEAFGSDEKFFGGDKEIKILDDFYKGRVTDDDTDDEAEADSVSEAWLVWSTAQDQFPADHREGAAHAGHGPLHPTSTCASTRATAASPATSPPPPASTPSPPPATTTAEERILTPLEALPSSAPNPDTPTAPLRPDHFDRETDPRPRNPEDRDHRRRQPQGRAQVGLAAPRRHRLRGEGLSRPGRPARPTPDRARQHAPEPSTTQQVQPGRPGRPHQPAARRGQARHRRHRHRHHQDRLLARSPAHDHPADRTRRAA
jgi:hypothetical protein